MAAIYMHKYSCSCPSSSDCSPRHPSMSSKAISNSPATPTAAGPSNANRRVKGKRTRTGCLTCRARKVKCDETPGTCANCERVLLACRWPVVRNVLDERAAQTSTSVKAEPHGESQLSPSFGPIRRNRQAACVACRFARSRCSQDRPSCKRCNEQGITCEYTADRAHQSGHTPSSVEASPDDQQSANTLHGIPRTVIDQHVEAFFSYVYPVQANAIVHRGTLMRDIADGKVARKVVLAVCAVASRFVNPPASPESGIMLPIPLKGTAAANAWATEAKSSLLTEDSSLEGITAALILAKHDINSGRFGQAFVLAAVATRMAMSLRLHQELPPDSAKSTVERETRRRLMWGCYALDRMMSTGVPEFLLTPARSMRIRLPCDDQRFLFGIESNAPIPALETEGDSSDGDPARFSDVGILGHQLRIQGVRSMIFRVSRNREPSDLPVWDPSSAYTAAERKIKTWYDSLSPQFHLNPETVYARKAQNELPALVMLHVWYHLNMVELTRLALPGFNESLEPAIASTAPEGWMDQTRDQCVHHARMLSNTLRHVSNLVDLDTLVFGDAALPICVYECVRVRLQYAFLLPPAPQAAELAELAADVEIMFAFLGGMAHHFSNAKWLLKETRRMLRRHGLDGTVHSDTSGAASPKGNDPWSSRIRTMQDGLKRPQSNLLQSDHSHLQASTLHHGAVMTTQNQHNLTTNSSQVMFSEPHSYVNWSHSNGLSQPSQDDVVSLLNEYTQSQSGSGSGFNSFVGMFGDWVAIGYDGGPIPALDGPLAV